MPKMILIWGFMIVGIFDLGKGLVRMRELGKFFLID